MGADLRSEYGVRLLDFYEGSMGFDELVGLVMELPTDSRIVVATHGEKARWDEPTYMIADIANGVRVLTHLVQLQLWSKQQNPGAQPQPPELIHEPGWEKPEAPVIPMTTTQELTRMMGGF